MNTVALLILNLDDTTVTETEFELACQNKLYPVIIEMIEITARNGTNYRTNYILYHCNITRILSPCKYTVISSANYNCRFRYENKRGYDLIFYLIDNQYLDPENYMGKKLLTYAFDSTRIDFIKRFLDYSNCNIDYIDNKKQTPLIMACIRTKRTITSIRQGYNYPVKDNFLETNYMRKIISNILDIGVINIGCVDKFNQTALLYLAKHNPELNSLQQYQIQYNGDVIMKLLDYPDCNPGHVNDDEETALILACFYGIKEIALKLLINFGLECNPFYVPSSPNCRDALEIARENNWEEVIDLINSLENKVIGQILDYSEHNPGYVNDYGETALIMACHYGKEDIALQLLTNFGLECNPFYVPSFPNWRRRSALNFAQENNMQEVVDLINCLPGGEGMLKAQEEFYLLGGKS